MENKFFLLVIYLRILMQHSEAHKIYKNQFSFFMFLTPGGKNQRQNYPYFPHFYIRVVKRARLAALRMCRSYPLCCTRWVGRGHKPTCWSCDRPKRANLPLQRKSTVVELTLTRDMCALDNCSCCLQLQDDVDYR